MELFIQILIVLLLSINIALKINEQYKIIVVPKRPIKTRVLPNQNTRFRRMPFGL